MKKFIAVATLCTLSSTAAVAGQPYLYGALGSASYDLDEDEFAQALLNEGFSSVQGEMETSSGMLKLGIGMEITPNLALEAGYTYLGNLETTGTTTGPSTAFNVEMETSGFEAVVIGKHPINEDTTLFGKVGLYAWETTVDTRVSAIGVSVSGSDSFDGTDGTLGLGLQYKQWRIEYQHYTLDDLDVNTFQIGYNFNL